MPYYSTFWDKHYKDIGNCCMTHPLRHVPFTVKGPDELPKTYEIHAARQYLDIQWMHEKKLKWIGQDKNGWWAWIDPDGIIYRVKDLKRNELGEKYEKEIEEIDVDGKHERWEAHLSGKEFFEWELAMQKDCRFCPQEGSDYGAPPPPPPSGGGIDVGDDEEEKPKPNDDWKKYAQGITDTSAATNKGYVVQPHIFVGQYVDYGAGNTAAAAGSAAAAAGAAAGGSGTAISPLPLVPLTPMPTGNPGGSYTPMPTNPVKNNGPVKANGDVVTPATSPMQKMYDRGKGGTKGNPPAVGTYLPVPTYGNTPPKKEVEENDNIEKFKNMLDNASHFHEKVENVNNNVKAMSALIDLAILDDAKKKLSQAKKSNNKAVNDKAKEKYDKAKKQVDEDMGELAFEVLFPEVAAAKTAMSSLKDASELSKEYIATRLKQLQRDMYDPRFNQTQHMEMFEEYQRLLKKLK